MTYTELRATLDFMLEQVALIRARIDELRTHRDFFDVSIGISLV